MRALDPSDPRSLGSGERRYRVLARIGSGGMGVVYFGRSAGGRSVAIKLVHAELARDEEVRARFRREVTAVRAVGGGFTAPLIDADTEAGIPYLVTEFLPAVPVSETVNEFGPLPTGSAWMLAVGVAQALVSIHRAGIVHRDLKPSNVLLTTDGPRVIDFGIAHVADAVRLTSSGARLGSSGFMSPEQVIGAPIGPASDIFSFGAMLAYACTGVEPFGDGTWDERMSRIRRGTPRLDGIADDRLRAMITSCLDRSSSRRPAAEDLASMIQPGDRPVDAFPLPPAVAAAIVAREREAENPPITPDRRVAAPPGGRRVLLVGALALGVGIAATAWYAMPTKPARTPPPRPTEPSHTTTAAAAPSRTLELNFTGTATLTSLTYRVNGRTTTLRHVKLPRRIDVRIPALPKRSTWRLSYRLPHGTVFYRVLADGFEVTSGATLSPGSPDGGHGHGTV